MQIKALPAKKKKSKNANVTLVGQALRTLGGLGGSALGGMLGQPIAGGSLGTGLGAAISRWLGQGDYTVRENSLVRGSLRASNSIPQMHNGGQSITVQHKEFISTIKGSVDFQVQRFFILQPGDSNTFPWLSGIADKFQQYRIKGMVFHYVPTSGYAVSGTSAAIGAVMMQTSYRSNDTLPSSKIEMLNEYWASESSPADSFCHPIECSPKENPFSVHYVRTQPTPINDSPLMYDLGVTHIATQGMPGDGNAVGDLWVTYDIEFSKPIVASDVTDTIPSALLSASSGIDPTSWFGSTALTATGQSVPFTMAGRTISMPLGLIGTYLVTIRIAAPFTAVNLSGSPVYVNCSESLADTSAIYNRTVATSAVGLNSAFYVFGVKCRDPSSVATITVPSASWTGTPTLITVTITSF